MRALLVSEAMLAPSTEAVWAVGVGALILTKKVLGVLGDDLTPIFEAQLPEQVPLRAVTVAQDRSRIAVAAADRVHVLTLRGELLWSASHQLPDIPGLPLAPSCLLDPNGMLWIFLPDEPHDHVVVRDARTGVEVAHGDLHTDAGEGQFRAHPDGVHVALRVDVGIEASATFWLRLARGRVLSRGARGCRLADLSPAGDFYLAMPAGTPAIGIDEFSNDTVTAERAVHELCAAAHADEVRATEPATIVDDVAAVVPVWTCPGSTRRPTYWSAPETCAP